MSEEIQKDEDELSLIDLFAVLWRRKVMIIVITFIGAIGAVTFSVVSLRLPPETSPLPNQFTASALMLIENRSSGSSSSVRSSAGMLASLVGISLPVSASSSELAVYLVSTNSMLDSIVDEFDLITRYGISESPKTRSRNALKANLQAEYDTRSGILTISFTAIDPVFARDIVNFCVGSLARRLEELGLDKNKIEKENLEVNIANTFQEIIKLEEEGRRLEYSVALGSSFGAVPAITSEINRIDLELTAQQQIYTQLKVQYELLKVEMASESPVFQILEMAEVPDLKSGPSRSMICIVATLVAGIFAVVLAFVLNVVSNIRNDPGAMARLRGKNGK